MARPITRWRIRPPIEPGKDWGADEFVPGDPTFKGGKVSFSENGRAQATKWVHDHNLKADSRQGPNALKNILESDAHKAMKQ